MLWLAGAAFALPSVDEPVRTGARASADSAVVVGIEDYFVLPDVPFAARDAEAVYRFLVYTRGVPSNRVQLLDKGANREQILAAVTDAGQRTTAGGRVWVYYSGHGAASPETGDRVLLGVDVQSDLATFRARSVSLKALRDAATAGGGEALFLLDTCYSGRGRSGVDLVGGKRFAVPAYAPGAEAGRVVEWTAAGPDQWSGPLDVARHGAFTYLALGALRGWADGQLDGKPDGAVTVEEAHLYVQEGLRALGVTDQRPQVNGPLAWTMSTAGERGPVLAAVDEAEPPAPVTPAPTPAEPTPPPPPAEPRTPGQLQVAAMGLVVVTIDGVPAMPAVQGGPVLVDASAGSHRVEVLSAFGKSLAAQDVQVRAGEQLRLQYRKKILTELGRGPRVEVPAATLGAVAMPGGMGGGAQDTGMAAPVALDPATFAGVLAQISAQPAPSVRLLGVQELAGTGVPLSAAQAGQLLALFASPNERILVAQALAWNLVDLQHIDQMLVACTSEQEKGQIRVVLATMRGGM